MKKWNMGIMLAAFALLFWLSGAGKEVQASGSFNLIQTVQANATPSGKWVKNTKGYRYRYKSTGKFAKNTWIRVKGKIYFLDQKGYRITGIKTYRKNRYGLDAKGRLLTGWQTINGKKYYFSKMTGAAYTGWNKIGKKNYYFGKRGVLQSDTWIDDVYVGSKGFEQAAKRIFVGDSRTVGMRQAVGGNDVFIAKWGEGYNWLWQDAVIELDDVLSEYPYSAVILNLGVNDLENVEFYAALYQRMRADYPRARFYFLSVNPVEETFLRANGFSGRSNAEIESFNTRMKAVFGSFYIDSYNWLIAQNYIVDRPQGCGTTDGLHYSEAVYQMLYSYVINRTK